MSFIFRIEGINNEEKVNATLIFYFDHYCNLMIHWKMNLTFSDKYLQVTIAISCTLKTRRIFPEGEINNLRQSFILSSLSFSDILESIMYQISELIKNRIQMLLLYNTQINKSIRRSQLFWSEIDNIQIYLL